MKNIHKSEISPGIPQYVHLFTRFYPSVYTYVCASFTSSVYTLGTCLHISLSRSAEPLKVHSTLLVPNWITRIWM